MQIELCGALVYYERHGKGEPLLLLHGWGGVCESFLPLTRDMMAEREVFVLDFPGHGRSSEPPTPWGVDEYAEMTAALLDALGVSKTDIVAHSFGGRVALLLAATHPERVGKMVLTGCAGLPPKRTIKKRARAAVYKLLKWVGCNPLSAAVVGAARRDRWRDRLQNRFGSSDYRALTPSMRQTFSRVVRQDLRPCLPLIKCPTLLVWGEDDQSTPLWMGKVMEKEIPDAGLVALSGAGHFAYLDRYGDFFAIARKFLIG